MVEKPGWWTWWWWGFPKEELKKVEKWDNSTTWIKSKQVWWRLWHTLDEVEELLKLERDKKRTR